jgi:hypothetical protein
MAKSEPTVLVCNPVAWGPAPTQARRKRCDLCGAAIWVALSSPRTDKRLCIPCAVDEMDEDTEIGALTAKQVADVKSKLG